MNSIEEYIEKISSSPLAEEISEAKNEKDEVVYYFIKKHILQKKALFLFGGNTKWTLLRESIFKNDMFAVGLFEYKHPISGEWLSVTGSASLAQEQKMQLGFPNLESHCYINAVKKIGAWFGSELNVGLENNVDEPELNVREQLTDIKQAFADIACAETLEELNSYRKLAFNLYKNVEMIDFYELKLKHLSNAKQ